MSLDGLTSVYFLKLWLFCGSLFKEIGHRKFFGNNATIPVMDSETIFERGANAWQEQKDHVRSLACWHAAQLAARWLFHLITPPGSQAKLEALFVEISDRLPCLGAVTMIQEAAETSLF